MSGKVNGVTGEPIGPLTPKLPPAKPGQKRKFDLEFKRAVAARIKAGEGIIQVSKELGVHDSQVRKWSKGEGMRRVGGGHSTKPKRESKGSTSRPVETAKTNKRAVSQPAATRRQVGREDHVIKDAISYLKHAQTWMYQGLRDGKISEFDQAHDLARMALRELLKLSK